ncbi:MAG TPA: TolC family protein [Chthoniobacter sp.]
MRYRPFPIIVVASWVGLSVAFAAAPSPTPAPKRALPKLRTSKVRFSDDSAPPPSVAAPPPDAAPRALTLGEAHEIALKKHPKITTARLLALATWQTVVQAKSAYYPNVLLNVAGVDTARENTREISQSVQVSSVVDRGGAGVFITQLLTDFGRTSNLVASSNAHAKSQDQNVDATREQVLLEVDKAYFDALRSRALVQVAQSTVRERRVVRDQVQNLAQNELRSSLDVSFADVNLQQAELLLSRTENDLDSAYATLAALLDETSVTEYRLADESGSRQPPANVSDLITTAFRNRPDLLGLNLDHESAVRFAKAERALSYPRVTLDVVGGELPYHDNATNENYAAGGVEVNWPIFNGKLFIAKRKEAELRAQASAATVHDAMNDVERDVRIAWLSANNAYKNMAITDKLREQAQRSLDLATARYHAGTSGIVELTQAQLALTSAQIDETNARYEYILRLSILSYQTGMLKK